MTKTFEMTIARDAGEWLAEDEALVIPATVAIWLDGNVCHKCPHTVALEVQIDLDGDHSFGVLNLRGKALPTAVATELFWAWEGWVEREVRDAIISAVCL